MAVVGDRYVITMETHDPTLDPIGLNPIINVFAYECTSGSPTANDLFLAFDSNIVPEILDIMAVTGRITNIDILNLDDVGDFDYNAVLETGTFTGDTLPLFTGFAFTYNRATRGNHNGRKTFAPIAEQAITNGVANGTVTSFLSAVAIKLGALLSGSSADYTPKIWRRAGTYKVAGVPTVFPDTFYGISGVTYTRVSTQNSRKR